jgi:predicted permease
LLTVAAAVVIATGFGVACERRTQWAAAASQRLLGLMLYVLVPYVSFVNFAHLRLSAGGGVGIVLAYVALAFDGLLAWWIGRRVLRLRSPSVGALICSVILVNTGYLGLPLVSAALGSRHLPDAVAYDQLVSSPTLLIIGFAIGALFGTRAGDSAGARLKAYLARNPPLLAVIAGLLTPASVVPDSLLTVSHAVVLAMLPLGFFVVGVSLSGERRQDAAALLERPDRRVLTAVGLRLLTVPAVLAGISALVLHLPGAYLVQAAMPTGVNSLLVGHAYGLNQRLIATVIVWSTIVVLVGGLVLTWL